MVYRRGSTRPAFPFNPFPSEVTMPPKMTETEVVMTVPDFGMSKAQLAKMKKKFEGQVVESLGGKQALAARRVRVRVIIVIVRPTEVVQ
jgi:hypothetical protein